MISISSRCGNGSYGRNSDYFNGRTGIDASLSNNAFRYLHSKEWRGIPLRVQLCESSKEGEDGPAFYLEKSNELLHRPDLLHYVVTVGDEDACGRAEEDAVYREGSGGRIRDKRQFMNREAFE